MHDEPARPDRLDRIAELFNAARRLPVGERGAFLDRCGDDEPTRAEVEALLAEEERPYAVLDAAAVGLDGAGAEAGEMPERIGRYRILSVLGHGGMGVVYEAAQDHPARSVALKVILPGLASAGVLKRFEHEAEALARLSHPGIAAIYEAGTATSEAGPRPYFAMELVRGASLTASARERGLGLGEVLRLTAEVADAVHYAHQRGVIHRDLKPSNILVTEDGRVRILDFGVAKLTDRDVRTSSAHTAQGQLIGTLAYMSPEQVAGDPLAVDIRADVYALGVILYELLAGRLPLEVENKPITEAARAVLEREPVPLGRVDRGLRGDLETIVGKALEKDRDRRYASAADLAGDIRRHLAHQPIAARPASTVYLVRKFARRHTAAVALGAAIIGVLIAGSITSTLLYLNADAGWARARRETEKYSAVSEFLVKDLIRATLPEGAGHDAKIVDALRQAETTLEERFVDQPEVKGSLRTGLGRMYGALGEQEASERQLRAGVELLRGTLGAEHFETINAEGMYIATLANLGRLGEAEERAKELTQRSGRALGPLHPRTVAVKIIYADVLQTQHKHEEAQALLNESLEGIRRELGPEHEGVTETLNILGASLLAQKRLGEAEAVIREELEIRTRRDGADAFFTVMCGNNLAETINRQGRFEEANPIYVRTLEALERTLPAGHWHTAIVRGNVSMNLMELRRFEEAEPVMLRARDELTAALGEGRQETRKVRNAMSTLYTRWGDHAKMEKAFLEEIAIRARTDGGRDSVGVVDMRWKLARFYLLRVKQLDKAGEVLAELGPLTGREAYPAELRFKIIAESARLEMARGELDQAQEAMARAAELHASAGLEGTLVRGPAREMAEALEKSDRAAEAERWRGLAGDGEGEEKSSERR